MIIFYQIVKLLKFLVCYLIIRPPYYSFSLGLAGLLTQILNIETLSAPFFARKSCNHKEILTLNDRQGSLKVNLPVFFFNDAHSAIFIGK